MELGATNMPVFRVGFQFFSSIFLSGFFIIFFDIFIQIICFPKTHVIYGMDEKKTLHRSADREVWDRKTNRVELFGRARVVQPGEILIADYILLDLNTRDVEARGNCVYSAADSVIFSDEMQFNLNTRTGTIINGRVTNERFTLAGEKIYKMTEDRYQTHWGEYTTCQDCPNSWSFLAEDVDMQIEGYATLKNVTTKIKDASAFWFPYIVIPIKTRRQTGILFPKLSFASNTGLSGVLPFFWALGRSADLTLGLGQFSKQGLRAELEGRYALSDRSGGRANLNYLSDQGFSNKTNRWVLDVAQTQELPWGFEQKLKINEVSDNQYLINYTNDVMARGTEKYLNSDLIFSYGSSNVSAFIDFRRSRNLFNTDSDSVNRQIQFDTNTVQLTPAAIVTTNDKLLFDSTVATGLILGVSSFTRTNAAFDDGVNTGDPQIIRKATRFSLNPSIYTTLRPFDIFSFVPSVQLKDYFYTFHNESGMQNLNRGYLLVQADLSAQLERIYETSDVEYPKRKHLIRPILTYSLIPLKSENGHPFVDQVNRGVGYNFDNYDVIPMDANIDRFDYFVPLGHSLAYGFTTQLIRRKGAVDAPDPAYQTNVEWSAGQAINFRELQKSTGESQPLSRLVSNLVFTYDQFVSNSTYYYYPYRTGFRHYFATSNTLIFERGMHQRILSFDRSLTFAYSVTRSECSTGAFCPSEGYFLSSLITTSMNYSLNDYILPTFGITYNLTSSQIAAGGVGVQFQSPSQCWRFGVNTYFTRGSNNELQAVYGIDFALNLTGSGFGGISEIANQAIGAR